MPTPLDVTVPATVAYPKSVKLEKFAALTEDSYTQWSRMAKAYIMAGGYWPFFSGKKPKPEVELVLID